MADLSPEEKRRRLREWTRRHGITPRETRILIGLWIDGRDIGASKGEMVALLKKLMKALWPGT